MPRLNVAHIILLSCMMLTVVLLWFTSANFRSASPVAHCYLRGMALSLGQAIESVTFRDPTLTSLNDFKSNDIAYFSVIGGDGRFRFHTNPELIGELVEDNRWRTVYLTPITTEERIRLGTGEIIFESQQQMHLTDDVMVLRLALHTWQADRIIHRARVGGGVIVLLLVAAWGLGLFSLRLQRRALAHREELAKQEHLAQLGKLGAVLAHEVRTPLAGIKGYAQLLEERLGEPRQQRFAHKIVAEAGRLERLVNELLTYARQESLPAGVANIEEGLTSAWDQVAAGAAQAGVNLEIEGEIGGPAAIAPDQLRQVLLNLLSNAVQAMPDGGRIRVVLSADLDRATVMLCDSGPGFSADTLKRAFDPFYTTRASGTGLGLAVCRKIMEGYGGSITVDNGSSGGAEVTLTLPLAKEHE